MNSCSDSYSHTQIYLVVDQKVNLSSHWPARNVRPAQAASRKQLGHTCPGGTRQEPDMKGILPRKHPNKWHFMHFCRRFRISYWNLIEHCRHIATKSSQENSTQYPVGPKLEINRLWQNHLPVLTHTHKITHWILVKLNNLKWEQCNYQPAIKYKI